jgi:two-component system CheB/CheR fusion protein
MVNSIDDVTTSVQERVPVASIGASAGGIVALQSFFEALPDNVGAAFVVIVHLDPEHASDLTRIIAMRTKMPVLEVTREQPMKANTVYVIPPNRRLLVSADNISSAPFEEPRGQRAPIDLFFRSMAREHGDGFAIILTGAGSDGAVGVKAVKEAGGLVLVQDPNEAEYPSMPRSAIASGVADLVLPVQEIAKRMPELVRSKRELKTKILVETEEEALRRILAYLQQKSGHDFSHYKRATIIRRVARRMQVTRCETLDTYLVHLRQHAEEVQALLADLLISVTSFFRDPAAFEALAREVIPKLFHRDEVHPTIRVWVAGCATGEEVYSIAILLLEEMWRREERPEIQIFASDLDASALAVARAASYPMAIKADVSEERLRRFFVREGDHYIIKREVRDLVVFAQHSILRDPPFSHIDLITCRNLLIYLDRQLQTQVARTFHYALSPRGYLFLGASETIDGHALFQVINREARIFEAAVGVRELPPLPRTIPGPQSAQLPRMTPLARDMRGNYSSEHRQALERLAPPSILVDESQRILNISETAGRFLLHAGGPLSILVPDVVRPELRLDVQLGLHRAFERNEPTVTLPVGVQFNGVPRQVSVNVHPIVQEGTPKSAVVFFLEGGSVETAPKNNVSGHHEANSTLVTQLRGELSATQNHLMTARAQYDTVTEELRASNEELQSINEEYRSTAEELETSKEELQSINEELQTLNNELKLRLDTVSRANNDLQNLMSATDVATLFLSPLMRINRFTPSLVDIINVSPGDEGRPISDFTHRLEYDDLTRDASKVLADLAPIQRTIQAKDGRWLLMRVRPYRTLEDKIDGVVITFVDVTERQEAEKRWESRQRLLLVELSRRVRDALATAQAIVMQSAHEKSADPNLQEAIGSRLQGLARLYELLINRDWSSVELEAVARSQLGKYIGDRPRIQLEGPHISLPAQSVISLGLLFDELATNAAKSGALSRPAGKVRVSWEVIQGEQGHRLTLTWRETGGPTVRAPCESAFSTFLIERDSPDSKLVRDFRPDGVVCTVEMPISGRTADQGATNPVSPQRSIDSPP